MYELSSRGLEGKIIRASTRARKIKTYQFLRSKRLGGAGRQQGSCYETWYHSKHVSQPKGVMFIRRVDGKLGQGTGGKDCSGGEGSENGLHGR